MNQTTELHNQLASPRTHTCSPPFPSQYSTEKLYSIFSRILHSLIEVKRTNHKVPTALFRRALRKATAETTSTLKPGAFWPALQLTLHSRLMPFEMVPEGRACAHKLVS
eukprot:3036058-Pleurochrysis_carterae.AAC.1